MSKTNRCVVNAVLAKVSEPCYDCEHAGTRGACPSQSAVALTPNEWRCLKSEVARLRRLLAERPERQIAALYRVVEEMRRHTDPMGGASGRMVGEWADAIAAARADLVAALRGERGTDGK